MLRELLRYGNVHEPIVGSLGAPGGVCEQQQKQHVNEFCSEPLPVVHIRFGVFLSETNIFTLFWLPRAMEECSAFRHLSCCFTNIFVYKQLPEVIESLN